MSTLARAALLLVALTVLPAAGAVAADPASPDGAAKAAESFPDAWFYADRKTGKRYAEPQSLEGKAAPKLELHGWIGKEYDLEKLKGKVVVVDFWATWCGPCMKSIPKNVSLVKQYGDKGLVFLGVHDARKGHERMPAVVEQKKINYSVAIDSNEVSAKAWKIRFWPTYIVLDRDGVVRAAGLKPDKVEAVVKRLLREQPAEKG